MNAQGYERMSAPLREHPQLLRALLVANKALTLLGYVAYPVLLLLCFLSGDEKLLWYVLFPACGFVVVSLARKAIDEPRPYEALDIDPLIKKDTKGQSMPSRHAFSFMVIALCWVRFFLPVGVVLVVLGLLLSVVRVVGGVHYPKDVLVGMACALVVHLASSIF